MNEFVNIWNTHCIRRTRNESAAYGQPVILYTLPELANTRNYGHSVSSLRQDVAEEQGVYKIREPERSCCDLELQNLCKIIMKENNFYQPRTAAEGQLLYLNLRYRVTALINS